MRKFAKQIGEQLHFCEAKTSPNITNKSMGDDEAIKSEIADNNPKCAKLRQRKER